MNEHAKNEKSAEYENPDSEQIVRKRGKAYYFSHETISRYERGDICFIDESGRQLTPSYFGAGLGGMNGVFKHS